MRPPQTDDELWELIYTLWGVKIPRTPVCPDHSTPFAALAEAFFGRAPVSVWKASRGLGGKSRTLAYLTLTEAVILGAEVNILGGSGAQSLNVHDAMKQGWDSALAPTELIKNETRYDTYLHNGAKIKAIMASQRAVRGPHPQRLRLDEIDEMDLSILDSALGQPMASPSVDTQVVMSSTHQYSDKTMTEILLRAGQRGWPIHEWCWKESSNSVDGWLTKTMIERVRSTVTKRMWEVEYDLQEPSFGGRAFDPEMVDAMFAGYVAEGAGNSDNPGLATYKHHDIERGEQYTFEEPLAHGDYVTGADWAKEKDWTVIATFRTDVTPWRLVAYSRTHRKPYPFMVNLMNMRLDKYGGRAIHDATGLGNVVQDYLDARVKGFIMSGRQRDDMLTEYIAAVERGDIVAPKIESAFSEHKYCSNEDIYSRGKDYHLPDTVCAFALCWNLRKSKRVKITTNLNLDLVEDSRWKFD